MLAKTGFVLPLVASLLEQTTALSLHRHQHAVEKRDVVWSTVWQTVYVTAGAESPAETGTFLSDQQPAANQGAAVAVGDNGAVIEQDAPAPAPTTQSITQQTPPPAAKTTVSTTHQAPPQTTLSTKIQPIVSLPSLGLSGILNSPSATASATPSSAPSSNSPGFSKRGLAYNDGSSANAFKSNCGNSCQWGYNWGSSPSGLASSISYVPMLWGTGANHLSSWSSDVAKALSNGAKALLSFNEPDMPLQANMNVGTAVQSHTQYVSKYKSNGVLIGSPAVTNSNQAGQGLDYLKSFMSSCEQTQGCEVDFCPVHWYNEVAAGATELLSHLEAAHQACNNKPIWLTEFALVGDGADSATPAFLQEALPKLESLDYLHAYSYFMVDQTAPIPLMSSNSALTTIGNAYAAVIN